MNEGYTCEDCDHYTKDNKCGDTVLLINRAPDHPACGCFLKEVV